MFGTLATKQGVDRPTAFERDATQSLVKRALRFAAGNVGADLENTGIERIAPISCQPAMRLATGGLPLSIGAAA